jgi:putative heme iron utilization protein
MTEPSQSGEDARKTLPPVPDFGGVGIARELLRTIRAGALATLDASTGHPFASLVTVATDVDGAPLLLMSALSGHTRNLEADPRLSILLAQGGKGDPLAHPRLTVIGKAEKTREPRVRSRFLARHPKAKLYADFADFSFWRVTPSEGHLNGGFARAMSLTAADLTTSLDGAETLLAAEESAIAHMNEDHRDAVVLYATKLAGAPERDWRVTGIDPEGLDLGAGDHTARVLFPHRVADPGDLRRTLADMARSARSSP